ncbi:MULTISPECIES: A/G-specific adenine glycosylase [unclassified Carboxylicivirga]|uniref:A/G-specific adenine glycosylase n=1 Tax=Carboxylicivirga TaxID=1628153 RepID=UPI003D35393C
MTDFALILSHWYRNNQRELPWRNTVDPYKIWLSEVILQQTRVAQGLDYYHRFIDKYPTVNDLGAASEAEVLRLWQGLGYYTRARNLHAAARYIVKELNGHFPDSYKGILRLKGVGEYTAAAIASIAFALPHAAVDGNVYRFLARYKGIDTPIDSGPGKKEFAAVATDLLDAQQPGQHNQAMMELGATVCKPTNPLCDKCPFVLSCVAYTAHQIDKLPVKHKSVTQKKRYFNYFFVEQEGGIYVEQRKEKDIWKNLYQLPLLETVRHTAATRLPGMKEQQLVLLDERKHMLTHQLIHVRFFAAGAEVLPLLGGNYQLVHKESLKQYPFSQLIANFINEKIGLEQD